MIKAIVKIFKALVKPRPKGITVCRGGQKVRENRSSLGADIRRILFGRDHA